MGYVIAGAKSDARPHSSFCAVQTHRCSNIVKTFKGISALQMFRFPDLRQKLLKGKLWTSSCCIVILYFILLCLSCIIYLNILAFGSIVPIDDIQTYPWFIRKHM